MAVHPENAKWAAVSAACDEVNIQPTTITRIEIPARPGLQATYELHFPDVQAIWNRIKVARKRR